MVKCLFFTTTMLGLLLVAGGCRSGRYTVITVQAEANAYERAPLYEAGAHARVCYRFESTPHSSSTSE